MGLYELPTHKKSRSCDNMADTGVREVFESRMGCQLLKSVGQYGG